jgi:hypothetical protein
LVFEPGGAFLLLPDHPKIRCRFRGGRAYADGMPLRITSSERRILSVLALLIVLGLVGMAVL